MRTSAKPLRCGLAWLLQNPVVTAPLIGPRTVEQLQQALHATTVTLSDDTMSCLDEIWPGPGRSAPGLCPVMTKWRHNLPRFQPDAPAKNMVLLEFAQSWARRKNTTPVQFALARVMAQRPRIVPIRVRRNIRT